MSDDQLGADIAEVFAIANRRHDHDKINQERMIKTMIETLSTFGGVSEGRRQLMRFDDGTWEESHGTTEHVAARKTLSRVPS